MEELLAQHQKLLLELFLIENIKTDDQDVWMEYRDRNSIERFIADEIDDNLSKETIEIDKISGNSMDIPGQIDSIQTSDQSMLSNINFDQIKRLKIDAESKYILVRPLVEKFQKMSPKDERNGYHLLTTKFKINSRPLFSILSTANKVVTTNDWRIAQDEVRIINSLDRIDKFKEENLWSFKQLAKEVLPARPKVQWDLMLEEMQWLSEDFRQELLWKKAAALNCAKWVVNWLRSTDVEKVQLQISIKPSFKSTCSALTTTVIQKSFQEKLSKVPRVETQPASQAIPNYSKLEEPDGIVTLVPTIDLPMIDLIELQDNNSNAVILSPIEVDIIKAENEIEVADRKIQIKPWKTLVQNEITINLNSTEMKNSTTSIQINISHNTYNIDTEGDFIAKFDSGLNNIPTYYPPKYDPGDMYIEDDAIVPVSKYMLGNYQVICEQREELSSSERPPEVKRLPLLNTYDTLDLILFFNETLKIEEIVEPSNIKSSIPLPLNTWSDDEEDALWQLSEIYSNNWELIAQSFHDKKLGKTESHSSWCCYEKFVSLKSSGFEPHTKADYLYNFCQVAKKDKKVKVLGLLSTFGYIAGLAKKRDANKHVYKSNNQVNLTAHDTHVTTQQNAGIDVSAPPLSSTDLSRIKEQRDKILEQNRQNAYYAQHARSLQIPSRAVPHSGISTSFRPLVRPQNNNALAGITQQSIGQFRPPFSPQQQQQQNQLRNASNYSQEQIQSLMMQQRLIARQQVPPGDTNANKMYSNNSTAMRAINTQPVRNQIQADMSTAAYVALQNATQQNRNTSNTSNNSIGKATANLSTINSRPKSIRGKSSANRSKPKRIEVSESDDEDQDSEGDDDENENGDDDAESESELSDIASIEEPPQRYTRRSSVKEKLKSQSKNKK